MNTLLGIVLLAWLTTNVHASSDQIREFIYKSEPLIHNPDITEQQLEELSKQCDDFLETGSKS